MIDAKTYKVAFEEERRLRWVAEKKIADLVNALRALGVAIREDD